MGFEGIKLANKTNLAKISSLSNRHNMNFQGETSAFAAAENNFETQTSNQMLTKLDLAQLLNKSNKRRNLHGFNRSLTP